MTTWQFITIIGTFVLSFFGFVLTILGTARATQTSLQASLTEQFTAFRKEIEAKLQSGSSETKAELASLRSEFKTEQAALGEQFANSRSELKAELASLRSETKAELASLRSEFKTEQAALSEQFANSRSELKAELASLRSELKTELVGVRSDIETLRNEVRQNDQRYNERFARIEADIREIKSDLRQVFKPVLPS